MILYIINVYTEVVFYYSIKLLGLIIRLRIIFNRYILIDFKTLI